MKADRGLTIARMVELGGVSRASFYRSDEDAAPPPDRDMDLRDAIQRIALEWPSYGRPRITAELKRQGWKVGLFSSSAMSSGRLFLDRVGRHQSPSPLHRRDQNKLIARTEGTIYHQTVSSVLTSCLTAHDKRRHCPASENWRGENDS